MTQLETITVIGVVVLAILVWFYFRLRSKDHVENVLAKHRASARVCSRACLLEGMEQIPVALALTADAINYENRDLQASIDLSVIEEVEYDDETATGTRSPARCCACARTITSSNSRSICRPRNCGRRRCPHAAWIARKRSDGIALAAMQLWEF